MIDWGTYEELVLRTDDISICYGSKEMRSPSYQYGKSYDITFEEWNPDDYECDYYEDLYL